MPASVFGPPASASSCVSGDVRAQVGFQRNRVGGRRHIVGGDFLDLVDGVCDDVQFALQTGDFLIGERDSGQIAQMHDFFA